MDTIDMVDAHCHLLPQRTPADLISQLDLAAVDMAVVLAVAPEDLEKTKEYNTYISDTVHQYKDRFIGFGSVHPGQKDKAIKELERFPNLGLHGVKFHPVTQNFLIDTPHMRVLCAKAGELGLPVMIHSYFPFDSTQSHGLFNLVTTHPDTTFILAHMGGHTFLDFFPYIEHRNIHDHVYFDISSILFMFRHSPYTPHIVWFIEKMGSDRVMFGSNYPVHNIVEALSAFDDFDIPFEHSKKILGANAADLFDL
ncbi:MAG: amidohydrolase family protein [Candidatus Methanofastidiosia archaeon]|jgi:predicted TIM-barrel fold metal-dependent hydrolase